MEVAVREVLLFFAAFVAVLAVIAVMVGWGEFVAWQKSVKASRRAAPDIMSCTQDNAPAIASSSLQTRPQTTPDQTDDPKVRREKLLDTYRVLRKHGISRNDARVLLGMWNLPLDNNLWAQAAPEDAPAVTPIAGRPTSAQFADPELAYQPPPR